MPSNEKEQGSRAEGPRGLEERNESIAIIGIGCRFPGGADSPKAFWELLAGGVDAISEVPSDRWNIDAFFENEPARLGKSDTKWGGFIDGISQFDADFFRISPREAALMDPQQRILLEVAWEALEDAGLSFDSIAGSRTGVFVGASNNDYLSLQQAADDLDHLDVHSSTGTAMSILANRISHAFDLRGASLVLDTACSSSLTALHSGCCSLRRGESTLALVGGINLLLAPGTFVGFSRLSMLSAEGRCKAFDRHADGYVRGEGAGVVVLKRFSEARRDGDRIYGLILGTGVNQDGRTSGLTVPSQASQEELLREICATSKLDPSQVDYVEAHGTGTPVGDPIEAVALGRVFGQARSKSSPLVIGSVKTNIGHLEPAAGIAGLIKTALCLYHHQIPGNLHFYEPNPVIPWESLNIRVAKGLQGWPTQTQRTRAAVCSYGFGGTNAAALLEAVGPLPRQSEPNPEETPESKKPQSTPFILTFSAKRPEGLQALAIRYAEHLSRLDGGDRQLRNTCWTAAARRTHFDYRLAVAGDDCEGLGSSLKAFSEGPCDELTVSGRSSSEAPPGPVFVFCGQGVQWWGMGRELLEREPLFRAAVTECDRLFYPLAGWSLKEEWLAPESSSRLNATSVAQPVLFAFQTALARLWMKWGIRPAAVIGHSVGEIAAAHVAGALSLEDAIAVVFHRSRCMEFAEAHGRMVAVALTLQDAEDLVSQMGRGEIAVAAVNSPGLVTLSGIEEAVDEVQRYLDERGVFNRRLSVDYAFHSQLMDPVEVPLLSSLQGIRPRACSQRMISSVTGDAVRGEELDAGYWWKNVRQAVLFGPAVCKVLEEGFRHYIEMSPRPILGGSIADCATDSVDPVQTTASLDRERPDHLSMYRGLCQLHVWGFSVDWDSVFGGRGEVESLPGYSWQHEEYWSEPESSRNFRLGNAPHPLLGRREAGSQPQWKVTLNSKSTPFLGEHQIQGNMVLPGAWYVGNAATAGAELFGPRSFQIEELKILAPCFLSQQHSTEIQTIYDVEDSVLKTFSTKRGGGDWVLNSQCRLRGLNVSRREREIDLDRLLERCPGKLCADEVYGCFFENGFEYGPSFRGLVELRYGEGEALGLIEVPKDQRQLVDRYGIHPVILDACLHTLAFQSITKLGERLLYVPVSIRQIRLFGDLCDRVRCWAQVRRMGHDVLSADIHVCDERGRPLLTLLDARFRQLKEGSSNPFSELFYSSRWESLSIRSNNPSQEETLANPQELFDRAKGESEQVDRSISFSKLSRRFDRDSVGLWAGSVCRSLRELGFRTDPGSRIELEDIVRISQDSMLEYCLGLLVRSKVFSRDSHGWTVVSEVGSADVDREFQRLLAAFPAFANELVFYRQLAENLTSILGGQTGASLLLESHQEEAFVQVSDTAFPWRIRTLMVERIVKDFLQRRAVGRPLRILELGAGTGTLTGRLLEALPRKAVEYFVTDSSREYVSWLQKRFSGCELAAIERFELSSKAAAEWDRPEAFDLILGPERCVDLAGSAKAFLRVESLLVPGGELLVFSDAAMPSLHQLIWQLFMVRDPKQGNRVRRTPLHRRWGRHRALTENLRTVASGAVGGLANRSSFAWCRRDLVEPKNAFPGAPTAIPAAGCWLILSDEGTYGEHLARHLEAAGQGCCLLQKGSEYREHSLHRVELQYSDETQIERALRWVGQGFEGPLKGVIDLGTHDLPPTEGSDGPPIVAMSEQVERLTRVARVLDDYESDSGSPRFFLLTRNSQNVDPLGDGVDPAQGAFWGFGRVLAMEFRGLLPTRIDIRGGDPSGEGQALAEVLLSGVVEDELAIRGSQIYRLVYEPGLESGFPVSFSTAPKGEPAFKLSAPRPGSIDDLVLEEAERIPPGPGEVEIEVAAAGLNFSDLMKVLGIYPGLADDTVSIGPECSGRIVRVGEDVQDLRPGQPVIALARGAVSSYVTTGVQGVMRKPPRLSLEEAATIPIAFLTAHHALNNVAKLQSGERVLIHLASGGVGLAAVQVARTKGAEIYATAGSSRKRAFLHSLGVRHVFDSRSLDFADEILELTGGKGVDVILNSLSGRAIEKGLEILAEYGRFLEIGKRDIYENRRIGLEQFRKKISFSAIDLDGLLRERADCVAKSLIELGGQFKSAELVPLAFSLFPASGLKAALKVLSRAQHIGKVLVSTREGVPCIRRAHRKGPNFRKDGTYLVSGGLSGFGLVCTKWIIQKGGGGIALLGRTEPSAESQRLMEEWRSAGITVEYFLADVGSAEQVEGALETVRETMPPLRGVFHAAAVFKDAVVRNLDGRTLQEVWNPKIAGAWNLHSRTLTDPLDFFVLFSSAAAYAGNLGQSAYASANAFLDGLAQYRIAAGLPGMSVAWGMIEEEGFAARRPDIVSRLQAIGMNGLRPRQALYALEILLRSASSHAAVLNIDWNKWQGLWPDGIPPRFKPLLNARLYRDGGSTGGATLSRIMSAQGRQRSKILEEVLTGRVAAVLGASAEKIDRKSSLTEMGMDSLMGIELRNWLESELGLKLQAVDLLRGPSIAELSKMLLERISGTEPAKAETQRPGPQKEEEENRENEE